MRALRDDEREHAAAIVTSWLIKHAVEATAEYPPGTNFVPVGIDPEALVIEVIVEEAGGARNRRAEIPMPAAA